MKIASGAQPGEFRPSRGYSTISDVVPARGYEPTLRGSRQRAFLMLKARCWTASDPEGLTPVHFCPKKLALGADGLLGAGIIFVREHAVLVGNLAVVLAGRGLHEQLIDDEPGIGADCLLDGGRDLGVLL